MTVSLFVNIISCGLIYINLLNEKEKRGRIFEKIDVDLLVSSMKGATIMKSIQEENIEYDKFVIGFAQKFQEMQRDYNNLSDENKIKFKKDITAAFLMRGMMGVTEYLARWK